MGEEGLTLMSAPFDCIKLPFIYHMEHAGKGQIP